MHGFATYLSKKDMNKYVLPLLKGVGTLYEHIIKIMITILFLSFYTHKIC